MADQAKLECGMILTKTAREYGYSERADQYGKSRAQMLFSHGNYDHMAGTRYDFEAMFAEGFEHGAKYAEGQRLLNGRVIDTCTAAIEDPIDGNAKNGYCCSGARYGEAFSN